MFQIRHSKESWIVEHSAGKFERHTVFANIGIRFDLVPFELKHPTIHDLLSHTILSETTTTLGGIGHQPRRFRLFRCRPEPQIKPSGHFRLDLPSEFAHPANRPRNPGLRGSERILLISEAAHEGARFHANQRLCTQARDDRPDIQLMHFGELPRPELVVRVFPGPVVPYAQGNGRQIGGLLAQAVWPRMGRLDGTRRVAPYGPPRRHAPCGTRNRAASGSTAGIRDRALVSPSAPPQRVPPDHQTGPRDVRTVIERRLDRALVHGDLRALPLSDNRGPPLDVQPIQQLLPRYCRSE